MKVIVLFSLLAISIQSFGSVSSCTAQVTCGLGTATCSSVDSMTIQGTRPEDTSPGAHGTIFYKHDQTTNATCGLTPNAKYLTCAETTKWTKFDSNNKPYEVVNLENNKFVCCLPDGSAFSTTSVKDANSKCGGIK
jgi:hypothetical protein